MSDIIYRQRHRGGIDEPAANLTDAEESSLLAREPLGLELVDCGPTTRPLPHLFIDVVDCGPVLGLDFEPAWPHPDHDQDMIDFDPRSNEEQIEELEDPATGMLALGGEDS